MNFGYSFDHSALVPIPQGLASSRGKALAAGATDGATDGAADCAAGVGVAAFIQFESALHALAVAGTTLLVAGLIGMVFMTWLQSRVARTNAAVLFIALLFFGWLWGIAGVLLGAPLVAIARVVCDRVEVLKPAGEMLGS